jgi:hypothetical protein
MAKQIKLSKIDLDQMRKAKTKEIIEGIYELFDVITAQYEEEVIDPETNKKN